MTDRLRALAAVVLAVATVASPAGAASCLATATPIAFGIYNPASSQDSPGAGTVTVTCVAVLGNAADAAYSIAMTAGAGSYAARSLASGSNRLAYNIYTDPGLTAVWGDGTGGTTMVSDSMHVTLAASAKSYTAYGRIPTAQTMVAAGLYSDTVIVTVAY